VCNSVFLPVPAVLKEIERDVILGGNSKMIVDKILQYASNKITYGVEFRCFTFMGSRISHTRRAFLGQGGANERDHFRSISSINADHLRYRHIERKTVF